MGKTSCTIVTCYYRFPSKHSYAEYDAWAARFLGAVETPMVIFCDAAGEARLREMRGEREARFVVLSLADTTCARLADWDAEHGRDPEADIHTTPLYVVWNEKSEFVRRAMEMNPFGTDAFAWCDVGCFRSDLNLSKFSRWPEGARLNASDEERLTLLCIQPFEPRDLVVDERTRLPRSFDNELRVGGTIMVGHRRAWERWIPAYYATLRRYIDVGMFAGKDQSVMASLVILRPDLVTLFAPSHEPAHGDPWFFLQPLFSEVT